MKGRQNRPRKSPSRGPIFASRRSFAEHETKMASDWPDEKTAKIIEMMRSRPELYNLQHKKYHDKVHKDLLYQEIGEQIDKEVDFVKKRIDSLRTQYGKLRHPKKKSGSGAPSAKAFATAEKMMEMLSFLEPYMTTRATISNLEEHFRMRETDSVESTSAIVINDNADGDSQLNNESFTGIQDSSSEEESEVANEDRQSNEGTATSTPGTASVSTPTTSQARSRITPENDRPEDSPGTPVEESPGSPVSTKKPIGKKQKVTPSQSQGAMQQKQSALLTALTKSIERDNEERDDQSKKKRDGISVFLEHAAIRLHELSPRAQTIAINEMHQTLFRVEMGMWADPTPRSGQQPLPQMQQPLPTMLQTAPLAGQQTVPQTQQPLPQTQQTAPQMIGQSASRHSWPQSSQSWIPPGVGPGTQHNIYAQATGLNPYSGDVETTRSCHGQMVSTTVRDTLPEDTSEINAGNTEEVDGVGSQ